MAGRLVAIVLLTQVSVAPAAGAAGTAPGAPGSVANWTEGDKDGFGSATSLTSKVWFTLDNGELTEVYYPHLGTPSARNLEFVVSDGRTFNETEREDARHEVKLVDRRSLSYRQVNTSRSGRWRITKTYAADPARATVLVDVRLAWSIDAGRPVEQPSIVACRYAKECDR